MFLVNDKTDLRQFFFRFQEKTLVHYKLHWKILHLAFKTTNVCILIRVVETVEYFLLPLPASFFQVLPLPRKFNGFRFHIPALCFMKKCFRFWLHKQSNASEFASAQLFSSKCFRKNLTASTASAFTSLILKFITDNSYCICTLARKMTSFRQSENIIVL